MTIIGVLPSARCQSSWAQVSIVSVSSPNCTTSGITAINCVFPTQLIVTTTGWGALNLANTFLMVRAPDGAESTGGGTNAVTAWTGDAGANRTLQATILPVAYSPSLVAASSSATAPLLNVSIISWGGVFGMQDRSTPAVPLVSFAYDAGPTLTSIPAVQEAALWQTQSR